MLAQLIDFLLAPYLQWKIQGGLAELVIALAVLHGLLAIATLGLDGRTICEILAPLRRILAISFDSLLEGIFEVVVIIPRALWFIAEVYLRAYFFAVRLVFSMTVSMIPAILIVLLLESVFASRLSASLHFSISEVLWFLFLAIWAVSYWRLDGHKVFLNFKRSLKC